MPYVLFILYGNFYPWKTFGTRFFLQFYCIYASFIKHLVLEAETSELFVIFAIFLHFSYINAGSCKRKRRQVVSNRRDILVYVFPHLLCKNPWHTGVSAATESVTFLWHSQNEFVLIVKNKLKPFHIKNNETCSQHSYNTYKIFYIPATSSAPLTFQHLKFPVLNYSQTAPWLCHSQI